MRRYYTGNITFLCG